MPTVTFFPDTSAQRAEAAAMDDADLAELIADPPEAPSKAACKLIKLGRFGDKRTGKNCLRSDENLLAVWGAEGDYDGEQVPMQEAAALLEQAGVRALFYTSPSHAPDKPRWRVLLPFSTEYPPEARNRFLARANGVLGGILAGESFTLSQTYYIGHVNGAVYEHADVEGDYIDQRNELDARAIWPEAKAKGDPKANQPDPDKVRRLIHEVMTGADYHDALNRLAAGYVARGMPRDHVIEVLQAMMLSHRTDGDLARWEARYNDIPRAVDTAVEKFAPAANTIPAADWPEPVDVFAEQPVPPFPLDCLPPAYAKFAQAYAAQSGFDPGAYGFCLLVNAANAIDHRSRLAVAHSFKVPPVLWGGLVDNSGGGKSPIINAASKFARDIDDRETAQSAADLAEWESLAKKDRDEAERPRWVQRLALDTTVEKLGDLLTDNPEGVFLIADELTELIGRLDAYSNGGGKDRATYLRAFDGGATTINRVGRGNRRIENFSLGILAGIQPDKLAELYRRNGGGGDGLYQRFLFYIIAPARPADYAARIDPYIDVDLRVQVEGLWRKRFTTDLSTAAAKLANEYHNNMRTLAQRTPVRAPEQIPRVHQPGGARVARDGRRKRLAWVQRQCGARDLAPGAYGHGVPVPPCRGRLLPIGRDRGGDHAAGAKRGRGDPKPRVGGADPGEPDHPGNRLALGRHPDNRGRN